MVRITKRGINKKLEKFILKNLFKEIKKSKTIEDLNRILNRLLTAEEQIMIKKRLAIIIFLKQGKRNKDIKQTLDVSKATISFVKRGLKKSSGKEETHGSID
jgi:uncharacterized protein YerC